MLRPTIGELLRGVREGLRESVLPALPSGHAQRQLKAALHTLARIERSWDRLPAYLAQDNADLSQTIRSVVESAAAGATGQAGTLASIGERLAALPGTAAAVPGIGDPALAQAAADNDTLQQLLSGLESALRSGDPSETAAWAPLTEVLERLYERMVERELAAWAAAPEE